MRALSALILAVLVACSAPRPTPLYSSSSVDLPARHENGRTLVLTPLGEHFGETSAFLSAMCNWIGATPAVSASYSAVWIATSRNDDALGDAAASLTELVDKIVSKKGDEGAKLRWAKDKTLDLAAKNVRAHLCFGSRTPSTELTLLAVSHVDVAPYGAGLRYLAISTDREPGRGFFRLGGGAMEKDIRHLVALVLKSPDEAVAVELHVEGPPEGRCDASTPGVFCVYQPSRAHVRFDYRDSPFVAAGEVEAVEPSGWVVVTKDGSKVDEDDYRRTFKASATGVEVDIHFRRPGTYVLKGAFGIKGVSHALREIPVEFLVQRQPILIGVDQRTDLNAVLGVDMSRVIGLPTDHPNDEALVPEVEVEYACFSIFIFCVAPPRDVITRQVPRIRNALRVVPLKTYEALLDSTLATLIATAPAADDDRAEWEAAIRRAVSDDELNALLTRVTSVGTHGAGRWCAEVTQFAAKQLHDKHGLSPGVVAVVGWTDKCTKFLARALGDLQLSNDDPVTLHGWHVAGSYLVDPSGNLATLEKPPTDARDPAAVVNMLLSKVTTGAISKGHGEESVVLVGVNKTGQVTTSVRGKVTMLGGEPWLGGTAFGLVHVAGTQEPAGAGFRIGMMLLDGIRALGEGVYFDRAWRTDLGLAVAPWCFYVATSSTARTLCRKAKLEPEVMWLVDHGAALGGSISTDLYRFPIGIGGSLGARVTTSGVSSVDAIELWAGVRLLFY